jgi:hypothetical protein
MVSSAGTSPSEVATRQDSAEVIANMQTLYRGAIDDGDAGGEP